MNGVATQSLKREEISVGWNADRTVRQRREGRSEPPVRNKNLMTTDLRSWIEAVEACGELKRLHEADWNKEIGTIVELNAKARGPALLFDRIKDYPPGFR